MNILADASLPHLFELFGPPFSLTLYHKEEEVATLLPQHEILLCRSTLKVTRELLAESQIKAVATASSGIDHIDSQYLQKQALSLFDAKGSNARAVADYMLASLAFLSQNGLLLGKKAGIIGLGQVGTEVASDLTLLGFDLISYDPPRALIDPHFHSCSWAELKTCDLLCIHANLHDSAPYPTAHLLAEDFFAQLKPGVVIINASRGGIVHEEALLNSHKEITYCTDVYLREPQIDARIVDFSTLCTPHIAGHSLEAKTAAMVQISKKLHDFFGLAHPQIKPLIQEKKSQLPPQGSWQDEILSLYNPWLDTEILKTSADKTKAFLTQRQAHQNRHEFVLESLRFP